MNPSDAGWQAWHHPPTQDELARGAELEEEGQHREQEILVHSVEAGMARAFWVVAYADFIQERMRDGATKRQLEDEGYAVAGAGESWDEAVPWDTPPAAVAAAHDLIEAIEDLYGVGISDVVQEAFDVDDPNVVGAPDFELSDYAENFGHYLAMMALELGVSWFDDHPEFYVAGLDFDVPSAEVNYDGEDFYYEVRGRLGQRGNPEFKEGDRVFMPGYRPKYGDPPARPIVGTVTAVSSPQGETVWVDWGEFGPPPTGVRGQPASWLRKAERGNPPLGAGESELRKAAVRHAEKALATVRQRASAQPELWDDYVRYWEDIVSRLREGRELTPYQRGKPHLNPPRLEDEILVYDGPDGETLHVRSWNWYGTADKWDKQWNSKEDFERWAKKNGYRYVGTDVKRNISAETRHSLPGKDFAVPELEGLPIDTPGRTRAAMSRFNQFQFENIRQKGKAYKRIIARARQFGIDSSGFERKWSKIR